MDTTISGRGFQTLPEVLFVLSSPDFKILRSQARSDPPTVRVSSLLWPELLWPLRGRRAAPSGPWAPLGSSRRTAGSLAGPSAVSGATRGWRPRRSWRWLQMSDGLVAEGPGFLSPTARRGPAGGVGDGLGVEGSQAAASGLGASPPSSPSLSMGEMKSRVGIENEDLENTSITSLVASASDPEPHSSPYRPQMVSPAGEDATEDLQKAAGALEAQALVEQELLPADQAQVLSKMAKYQVPQRSGDIVVIQSEHTGAIDILSADLESADLLGDHRKVSPPLMAPPCIWTFAKMKEFKSKLGKEKNSRLVVKRGEVVTIRVPTHPEGKRVCWEFATDDYDIGFGVYFDWTPVTSTDITVQVSDSSEDEDEDEDEEEEIEDPVPAGDVERGSRSSLRGRYGEVMPVYRRDSHRDVQAGSHDYPGEGIYLLKFDNSYSLLRNKTLYFHIYYTS
ncbi:protein TMED8 isoform X3 [Manis pentadactyla]|uniref:protein TMED8 isoform X3 n=1 Tax=Manis pentadactyla TaxID=143292 RepID=UPI00255CFE30|nr:protein TMED8 isoform X3 [Manis pentadactyla]